jgi:integrase
MAYIKKKSERKFKITVCNGYKVNGQKRMKAQTITVPSSVPKRGMRMG